MCGNCKDIACVFDFFSSTSVDMLFFRSCFRQGISIVGNSDVVRLVHVKVFIVRAKVEFVFVCQ